MEQFTKIDIGLLQDIAKNYIRFRDRNFINFYFAYDGDELNTLKKLKECLSLFSYCKILLKQREMLDEEKDYSELCDKLNRLIFFINNLNFFNLLNEFSVNINLGRSWILEQINKLVDINRDEIICILNFADMIRPAYVKPLGKSTGGVSSDEYNDILMDEGGGDPNVKW